MNQTTELDLAVQAYMNDRVDLRGGAQIAGVSYNRFMRELENRRVVILEDDHFLERLSSLADLFGDDALRAAAQRVAEQSDLPIESVMTK
ncbi:MAG: hypothetical protein DWI57_11990 [Chloroflexi bacterium]|nr:MAG: hypothetical protein DWI57_11990 [Chloroflexota bacterium]